MELVTLDAGEQAAIRDEAQRLLAQPPPADRRGIGCITVVGAGLLLLLLPPLSKRLGWPPLVADVLFWALAIVLALGLFAAVFLTTSRYSQASSRAHEALAWLASHADARDAKAQRHAVTLICYHTINDDGGQAQVIDIDEAKATLGAALPFVIVVERVLYPDPTGRHFDRA